MTIFVNISQAETSNHSWIMPYK